MVVLATSGNDVPTVIQEMDRLYGNDSFGIVPPAAIMQAQQHMNIGSSSFTIEVRDRIEADRLYTISYRSIACGHLGIQLYELVVSGFPRH